MQEGKNLGKLKIVLFGREIFTVNPVAYITVDFKKLVSDPFHAGSAAHGIKRMYQEKIKPIRIAPKHNNSLETSPYAIHKHHTMHQSDFTLQIPS